MNVSVDDIREAKRRLQEESYDISRYLSDKDWRTLLEEAEEQELTIQACLEGARRGIVLALQEREL